MRACVVVPSLAHEEEELEQHAKKKACESVCESSEVSRECGKPQTRKTVHASRTAGHDTRHTTVDMYRRV